LIVEGLGVVVNVGAGTVIVPRSMTGGAAGRDPTGTSNLPAETGDDTDGACVNDPMPASRSPRLGAGPASVDVDVLKRSKALVTAFDALIEALRIGLPESAV
jgi:hypothetical protein